LTHRRIYSSSFAGTPNWWFSRMLC